MSEGNGDAAQPITRPAGQPDQPTPAARRDGDDELALVLPDWDLLPAAEFLQRHRDR